MSILGIDVGTTGCKSAVFSRDGFMLAIAYEEYNHKHVKPGWAELDSVEVWNDVKKTITHVVSSQRAGTIEALAVTSLGEAVVPVSAHRKILGPSILNYCKRGEEYFEELKKAISPEELYAISGSRLGTLFGMLKIMWIRDHQPDLYKNTNYLLPWTSFISFMLGAEPVVDYSLANRTLLFDINQEDWSDTLLSISGLDKEKLPNTAQAGTKIGSVSNQAASETGLLSGTPIIIGAHDQCTNAVGCGAIEIGQAMLGLGTFPCATPVFQEPYDPKMVIPLGVNTEHHAVPNRFVSLVYNQGGSVIKWYRDSFAALEHKIAKESGVDIYEKLFAEMPEKPARTIMLPYYSTTGLPDLTTETSGVMTGLRLSTDRGEILKGIIESIVFDLRVTFDALDKQGINISQLITVGGGSKSDAWIQVVCDILNRPAMRPKTIESGALGAAIIAGVGSGIFPDYGGGVQAMVKEDVVFMPNATKNEAYNLRFNRFLELKELLREYLAELSRDTFITE